MSDYSGPIEWAKRELKGNEDLYHEEKAKIIRTTADKLKKEGMPKEMISSFMTEQLEGYTSARTIRDALGDEFKDKSKVRKQHKTADPVPQIAVQTDGKTQTEPDEKASKTFNEVTKDIPPPKKDSLPPANISEHPEYKRLLEINKFQSEQLKAIKKIDSVGALKKTDIDCTDHPMYEKVQAVLEKERAKRVEAEERAEKLDSLIFKSGTEVESPPDTFRVNKDADMMKEYFYSGIAPTKAIQNLRQILNSVTSIDIGWRVIE